MVRDENIAFGRFLIRRRERVLLADGVPVELGSRAFDVLLVLIDANGALVTKDELLNRVWPDAVVEENNLQVQVFALRKVLGEQRDLIRTVPRHGYRFTGITGITGSPVASPVVSETPSPAPALPPEIRFPAPVGDLFGREADILRVVELLTHSRLVTLTGPGGIGKTSLALAVARRLIQSYPDGIYLADFSPLADADLVPATVAAALDLRRLDVPVSPELIAAAIGTRRLLIVLDNCEHVIETATRTAEGLLHGAPRVRVIATSREPLRAEGESVIRVPSLDVPETDIEDTESLLSHAALRLFVSRVRAADTRSEIDHGAASAIASICRRLDGIPLAIELAAARASLLGIEGVAAGLDDRFRLLTAGRRTALRRHQTLRATMDWSFDLLSQMERTVFCRLGVFAGCFTLQAAIAVASDTGIAPADVADCLANLAARSLVGVEDHHLTVRYRLLETMRVYALERVAAEELQALRRRHLLFYLGLMQRAEQSWENTAGDAFLETYGSEIENVRAALQSSFASDEDAVLGAMLVAASTTLWMELSLHSECRRWVEQALSVGAIQGMREELVLLTARGSMLLTTGGDASQTEAVLRRALAMANARGDHEYGLRAGYNLMVHYLHVDDYGTAHELALSFRAAAAESGNAIDTVIGDRIVGGALHYLGRLNEARAILQQVVDRGLPNSSRTREARFGLDQEVAALTVLARVMGLQGFPDQAMAIASQAVERAEATNRVATLCHALGDHCVVALWTGQSDILVRSAARLHEYTERYGLRFWRAHALVSQGHLAVERGDYRAASPLFDAAVAETGPERFGAVYPSLISALAEGLAKCGRAADALAVIDQVLDSAAAGQHWYIAEFLILEGELCLIQDDRGAGPSAEILFRRALDHLQRQPALSFELRASIGLAKLMARDGREADALAMLTAVYRKFTEGHETALLKSARELMRSLRSGPVGTSVDACIDD